MKSKNKIFVTIGLTWLVFLIVSCISLNIYLSSTFAEQEQRHVNGILARADSTLKQITAALDLYTIDWSHSDTLYQFIKQKNSNSISNVIAGLSNANIGMITIWNLHGQNLYGATVDTNTNKLLPLPEKMPIYSTLGLPLVKWTDPNHTKSGYVVISNKDMHVDKTNRGYINLRNKLLILSARAIIGPNSSSLPVGVLIVGRDMMTDLLKVFPPESQTQMKLVFPGQLGTSAAFNKAQVTTDGHYLDAISDNTMAAYTLLKDTSGKPIAMLDVTMPRTLYLSGLHSVHVYLASYIFAWIFFSLLIFSLLRNLEWRNLKLADTRIKNSITNPGLSTVATEINTMIDVIDVSYGHLEKHVEQRTQELHAANVQLQQEISERKSIEKELLISKEHLARLAHYDSITTLPNRIFFNEILNKTLQDARRHKRTLAVLFVDIDGFKNINSIGGHNAGDMVLKEIALRFSAVLRPGDILARLGGDEFIILLNDIDHAKFASHVAEKLLKTCAQPVNVDKHEFFLSVSIGICLFPNDGESLEDLQKNADMAMYKAKCSGGGVFQYFTKEMVTNANEHVEQEETLHNALHNNEFILYYQPLLNLKSGRITGLEALIRWNKPGSGVMDPATFIPLAEKTGLIIPIGEWVLREACKTNKKWQEQGYEPLTISVNLSVRQLRQRDIAEVIGSILAETGLNPKYLNVEITEATLMDNMDIAIKHLHALKKMGITISIDDFGTGYTSISHLRSLPVDFLKIDRSFIKSIPDSQNDAAVVNVTIAMAHHLNIKVVAEGVETLEQLQYLAKNNCDIMQGYFIGRPLPENKIMQQLTAAASAAKM